MTDISSNPYTSYRSVPIDPDTRLPATEKDSLSTATTLIHYDFGNARPARILKSVPGARGTVDKEATMRGLSSNAGAEEKDLRGTWTERERMAGGSTNSFSITSGSTSKKMSRPSSAATGHRHNSNSHGTGGNDNQQYTSHWSGSSGGASQYNAQQPRGDTYRPAYSPTIIETPGRFADTFGAGGTGRGGGGVGSGSSALYSSSQQYGQYNPHSVISSSNATHYSPLDIGAGTAGDSMVTQFPSYATPLTHPYLPTSALVSASVLHAGTSSSPLSQSSPPQANPIHPDLFTTSLQQLREAQIVIAPPSQRPGGDGKQQSWKEREKERVQKSKSTAEQQYHQGGRENSKETIEKYLEESRSLDQKKPHENTNYTSHSAREKERYEKRVNHLESQLVKMQMKPGKEEEDYLSSGRREQEEQKYADDDSFGTSSSHHPLTPSGRLNKLQSGLESGHILTRDFQDNLQEMKRAQKEKLKEVEDRYYQGKLGGGNAEIADLNDGSRSNRQKKNNKKQAVTQQQQQQRPDESFNNDEQDYDQQQQQQQQYQPQQFLSSTNPIPSTSTSPRSLAYGMSRSLGRNMNQHRQGVADSEDMRENIEKKKLAANFDVVDDDDDSSVNTTQRSEREKRIPVAKDTQTGVKYDQYGQPIWKESKMRDEEEEDSYQENKRNNKKKNIPLAKALHDSKTSNQSRRSKRQKLKEDEEDVSVHSSRDASQSRSRSASRSSAAKSRSRSPSSSAKSRSRSHSRSQSRSASPSSSSSTSALPHLTQPRSPSSSQKHAESKARAKEERKRRYKQEHGVNELEEGLSPRSDAVAGSESDGRGLSVGGPKDISSQLNDGGIPSAAAGVRLMSFAGGNALTSSPAAGRQKKQKRPSTASRNGRPTSTQQGGQRPTSSAGNRSVSRERFDGTSPPSQMGLNRSASSTTGGGGAQAFGYGRGRQQQQQQQDRPSTAGVRGRSASANRAGGYQSADNATADDSNGEGASPSSANRSRTRRPVSRGRMTQPEPFSMSARLINADGTTSQPSSRSKQRFEEYLTELRAKEEEHLTHQFRATPLPQSTLEPRYNRMIDEQVARSRELRKARKQLTQEMIKPFDFSASRAVEERKKERRRRERKEEWKRMGGKGKFVDEEDDSENESSSKKKKNKKRQSLTQQSASDSAGGGGSDVDQQQQLQDQDSDDSDAASAHSYQVAFGFTTREKETNPRRASSSSSKKYNPHSIRFRANKIPWTSQVNLLSSMLETREKSREERVKERSRLLLEASALPKRMEMHAKRLEKREKLREEGLADGDIALIAGAQLSESEKRRLKNAPPAPTFSPSLNTEVPDFEKLQAEFAENLEKVKKKAKAAAALTRVKEFAITPQKVKKQEEVEVKLFKAKPYIPSPQPTEKQPTTEKHQQLIEKNKKLLKERKEKEDALEKERLERLKQNPDMISKLIPKITESHAHGASTTDETIRELTRQAKKDMKEKDAAWEAKVDAMKQRVRTRPLLIETYNTAAGRLEARKKALLAIKESLDKAGIRDQSKFFDKEELADLGLKF